MSDENKNTESDEDVKDDPRPMVYPSDSDQWNGTEASEIVVDESGYGHNEAPSEISSDDETVRSVNETQTDDTGTKDEDE